ncbi:3'-5' exonuclease [Arcticibacterium luteifluviistationis]|uniref:3'-5' exonuclease n=1 Tax=Arcticibacterium luteifluviistationis TaxID=1784714 RepID=A0A2Z4GEX1_9BACT|nr:3'-5' exonuclease [Arcticibacterium luteifluviistationis]AWV99902.1 3'-5' exonuclease [Arcticibacterium luteifluviistationis]
MDPLLFNILFLDIETAALYKTYEELPDRFKPLWDKKASYLKNDESLTSAEIYNERAAIYSEFGQVICIGIGGLYMNENKELSLKTKVLSANSEKELLQQFSEIVDRHKAKNSLQLCAHNGKEFDFPYLSRRMLINGLKLPDALDLGGKKPWEINHIDTMELWKFGDYKKFTSLDLLAAVFDIPSSKSDISGADVNRVYHEENDLEKIKEYCGRDVGVLAQLYLKMKGLDFKI